MRLPLSHDSAEPGVSAHEYVKVVPSTASLETDDVIGLIKGLRKVDRSSRLHRLNPFTNPPVFEFIVHSGGVNEPIHFLFGCSDENHLDLLERKLRSAYPDSFDISRTRFSLESALSPPGKKAIPDGGIRDSAQQTFGRFGSEKQIDKIHEPGTPEPVPFVVRWDGVGEKSGDWMTTLSRYSRRDGDQSSPTRSPLSYLLEVMSNAEFPIVYQVLFHRRPNWSGAASRRKNNIRLGQDGFADTAIQWLFDLVFGPSTEEQRDRYRGQTPTEPGEGSGVPVDSSDDIAGRAQLINAKIPARTFTVNIRAVALAQEPDFDTVRETMASLQTAFDTLDGYFYAIEGSMVRGLCRDTLDRLTKGRVASAAHREFQRMQSRSLVSTSTSKRRPHLVTNHDELANFVTVPSAKTLTAAGGRATEGTLPSSNPLPRPSAGSLASFRNPGMAIGHALDKDRIAEPTQLTLTLKMLLQHLLLGVPTGGGKSIWILNAVLSLFKHIGGPTVVVDPKGEGLCEDYMRVHKAAFGSLDDVYYFPVPEVLPAIPFYDIRPLTANPGGRNPTNVREEAIQDKVEYTHEILRMVMGRDVYDRVFANTITSNLIHALFDEEYGQDAFGLDDLYEAACEMQEERIIPPTSPGRPNDPERSLTRHFAKDKRQFQRSMDAVLNRLEEIKNDRFLAQIFSTVPEWDEDRREYEGTVFDFRRFLDEDVVILFDLGDLRAEAQSIFTIVLLSHVWDAVQDRIHDGTVEFEKITNLFIDEAAPIAATEIVSERLLPQARGFGLAMTLLVQYPRQIRNINGVDKAYEEVLNNVHTKIIGDISTDTTLLNSLVHDELDSEELQNRINRLPSGEWVVQLPSPAFGASKPPIFSLQPSAIPAGHPESESPLSDRAEHQFRTKHLRAVLQRTRRACGIRSPRDDTFDSKWGSHDPTSADEAIDQYASMFIEPDNQIDDSDWFGGGGSSPNPVDDVTVVAHGDAPEEPPVDETSYVEDLSHWDPGDDDLTVPSPIPEAAATVTDDVLEDNGLTRDDARFLKRVLDAMNDDLEGYSLLDSMTTLTVDLDDLDISKLVADGFLEEASVSRRRYYTVLPKGRSLLDETLSVGPGAGDLGEKTPHKVGVKLLASWLEDREAISRVEPYYEYGEESVFDVAGFDDQDDLRQVGEVELLSNDTQDPVRDFDKIDAAGVDGVWVFKNREEAVTILDRLADAGRLDPVTGRARKSIASLRQHIEAQDLPSLRSVRTFRDLESELDR